MSLVRYCSIVLLIATMVVVTGCSKRGSIVVNTPSVVIDSKDFTQGSQQRVSHNGKIKQVAAPTAKSSGAVIDLGSGYEKIELEPIFGSM